MKGDEVRRLFKVWPDIADALGLDDDDPGRDAMDDMGDLLRDLYRSRYRGTKPWEACAARAAAFRRECCDSTGGGSNYIYQMEFDFPRLLQFYDREGFGLSREGKIAVGWANIFFGLVRISENRKMKFL